MPRLSLKPGPAFVTIKDWGDRWIRWLGDLYNWLTPEDWHEVGGAGQPAFENNWTHYSTNNGPTSFGDVYFRKDPFNVVHFKGMFSPDGAGAATSSTVFTLPVGYRPPSTVILVCKSGTGVLDTARVDVTASGAVAFQNVDHGTWANNSAYWVSLDGTLISTDG